MVKSLLFVIVMLLTVDSLAAERNKEFVVSAEGYVAVVGRRQDGYELALRQDGQEIRLALKRLDEVTDVLPNPKVAISSESKFIAVGYSEAEMTSMVSFFEADNLREVRTIPAMEFAWSNDSTQVILVPNYEFDEGQKTGGLVVLNVDTGASHVIAQDFFFTGEIDVRGEWIAGRTANDDGSRVFHCFAIVNINNSSASEFDCRTTGTEVVNSP